MYRNLSVHHQDSGVVLINKSRGLMGLLATCLLNTPLLKNEVHSVTHGDKETYWIGYEIAQDPYHFSQTPTGTMGTAKDIIKGSKFHPQHSSGTVCGQLAHFDDKKQLIWFSGGLRRDVMKGVCIDYSQLATQGTTLVPTNHSDAPRCQSALFHHVASSAVGTWKFDNVERQFCLVGLYESISPMISSRLGRIELLWCSFTRKTTPMFICQE